MLSPRATAISCREGLFALPSCTPFFPRVRKHRRDNNNLRGASTSRVELRRNLSQPSGGFVKRVMLSTRFIEEHDKPYVRVNGGLAAFGQVALHYWRMFFWKDASLHRYLPKECGFNKTRMLIQSVTMNYPFALPFTVCTIVAVACAASSKARRLYKETPYRR